MTWCDWLCLTSIAYGVLSFAFIVYLLVRLDRSGK